MIVTEGFDEVLDLGRVYANGLHSLRLFRIRNQQPYPVEVRLQSDLDGQITFQTFNENLNLLLSALREHTTLNNQQILSWTTNTVDATEKSINILGDDSAERQFNLLFNYVNIAGSIRLDAHECRDLVLSFLPTDTPEKISSLHRSSNARDNTPSNDDLSDRDESTDDPASFGDDTNDGPRKESRDKGANESTIVDGHAAGSGTGTGSGTGNGRRFNGRNRSEHITEISSLEAQTFDQDESFFYHDVQGSIYFLVYPLEQNGIARPAIDTTTAPMDRRISVAPPAFVKSTHVTARVCRSFLWSDISGTVISLPDCMPGETHVKDFTVWNRSEIDLYFRLEATQLGAIPRGVADELTFIDADTGDPIGQRPIPGFGHRRLRATFCPSSVGNYTFDIRLENENDAYNSEEARIQAVVKSLAVSASLIVNEETLDFGVCYSGHGYSRKFVVKNVSELPVEVHLQAQDANVKFYPIAKESISDETAATTPTTSMAATPDLRATSTSMGASRDTGGLLHSDIDLLGLGLSHSSGGNTGGHATSTNTSGNPHSSSNLASSSKTNANNSSAIRSSHMEPIEELIVKPGVERVIMATYTPRPDASSTDYQAGRLLRRTFRIQLSISSSVPGKSVPKAYKVIQCRAKTCTSFINTSTSILNFGDTDVGVLKSLPLVITNYSELPAQVQIRFASKILTCDRQQISIPPKQSQEVKFEIYPRKVNPEYRKQVEIVNLNHRQDNQIVEVKSNNVDRKGVSFHSLFYRVITTVGINYLDFGTVICGAPIIRAMMIDNISGKELALSLSTSDPDHIRLFTVASDEPGNLMSLIDSAPLSPVLHRTSSPTNVDTSRVVQLVSNDSRSTTMTSNHLPAPQPLFASASATNEESRRNVPLIQQPMESMDFLDLALPVISGGKKASRRRRIADQGRRIAGVRPQHQDTTSITTTATSTAGNIFNDPIRRRIRGEKTHATTQLGSDYHHHQDIANASMSQRRNEMTDAIWNKVLAAERELSMVPPVFASQMAEESYVQEQIALRSQLQAYIDDGLLVPLTNDLVVEAHSKRRLMVWYQPIMPALKTDTTNPRFDTLEHVAIRLVRFNRDAIDTPSEALPVSDNEITIPVRQVLLKARLRQINLEIGQRSINLGPIGKEERRTNVITIRNRGELPLLYALKKSGSALSGDIVFRNGGQSGVVRGFSVREVEFVYQPSLSGDFSEKIIVENVLDPQNNGAVLVKAFVRKSTHFYVKPTEIDLGPCLLGGENTSPVRSALMITNTDYQTRTFVARVEKIEYPGFTGRINFHVERSDDGLDGTGALLSEDAQEKIESLEQKMKIARRKGRSDKVKKLEDKLDRLRRGTPDEPQVGQGLDDDEDELHVEEETDTKASTNPQGGGDESELETPSNDPANEASIRVIKITPESITFSLVGRITEKLWITLDTTLTEEGEGGEAGDNSSAIAIEQTLMGTITVHEQKNTDVSQQIAFTAQVFRSEDDYQRALTTWKSLYVQSIDDAVSESESTTTATAAVTTTGSNQTTMPATPATSTTNVTAATATTTNTMNTATIASGQTTELSSPDTQSTSVVMATSSDDATPIKSPLLVETETSAISISPTTLLFSLKLGESISHTIHLTNSTDNVKQFYIRYTSSTPTSNLSITWSECNSDEIIQLSAGEKRTFSPSVQANSFGWHYGRLTFSDIDQQWTEMVPLECYAHAERLLHFPALDTTQSESITEGKENQSEKKNDTATTTTTTSSSSNSTVNDKVETLDLGFCYMGSNKYAQIVPLMMSSQTDEELQLSCQSNLSQVLVFLDSHATRPASQVILKPRSIITLWIAVQPSLNVTASRNESRDRDGDIRRLIGGLRFTLTTPVPDQMEVLSLGSQILRFTTTIGRSILSLSQKRIHLGWTPLLDERFYGQFSVINASARIPAAYELECYGSSLSVDRSSGTLGVEGGDNPPEATVHFRMNSSRYGHLSETISVINVHNPQQVLDAKVQLLVDDERVALQIDDSSHNDDIATTTTTKSNSNSGQEVMDTSDIDQLYALPRLTWDCSPVIVVKVIQPDGTKEKQVQRITEMDGDTLPEKSIQLENTTDTPILLSATSELGQAIRWNGPCNPSDQQWLLPAKRTASLTIAGVNPVQWIDTPSALERGEQVTISGLLEIRDIEQDRVIKAINIYAPFAISKGQLNETELDLGQVGYINSWQPIDISCHLRNLSPLPLHYAIEWPEFIVVHPDQEESNDTPIEAFATRKLQCQLYPDRLPDKSTGETRYELLIRNLYNPTNTMSLRLTMEMTTFDLRFERLHNDELTMPSLQYPTTTASVPCDSWFKVVNTSAQDIRFDIGTELSTQVDTFIRLDVLSRFSNSPLKGGVSLAANGSIEVRVVASLRPGVRLSSEMRSIIVHQTSIVLGKIWVTTQLALDALETRLTEDIIVRGTIMETCAFNITEKMMQLSIHNDDSSNSNACNSSNSSGNTGNSGSNRSNDTAAQFVIHNLAKDLDLSFRLVLENPPGVPLSQLLLIQPPLLEEEDVGSVRPEEQLVLRCWLRPNTSRLPDAIRICVIDMHALTEQSSTLTLRVPAMAKRAIPIPNVVSSTSTSTNTSTTTTTTANTNTTASIPVSSARLTVTTTSTSTNHTSSMLLPSPPKPAPPIVTSSTSSYNVATSRNSVAVTAAPTAVAVNTNNTTTHLASSPSTTTAVSSRLGSPLMSGDDTYPDRLPQQYPVYLTIRGCRRIDEDSNRFELDLGQLSVGSPAIVKSMVLTRNLSMQHTTHDNIPYTLSIVPVSSASWLSVNRTRGRLGNTSNSSNSGTGGTGSASGTGNNNSNIATSTSYHDMSGMLLHDEEHNEQTLTITVIPGEISVSTAHIVIESSRDPIHRIMIRVNMEVVAKQNLLRSSPLPPQRLPTSIFSVSTSYLQGGEGLIEMPYVNFNSEYVMRSIMIRNHDAVTLPFTVTADLGSDPSDVVFSTSRTSAKLFSTLYVDGGHTTRVYIRFRPMPSAKALPATNNNNTSDTDENTGPAEQKTIRIYVGCRLVKDYQFAVNLKANCSWPTLSIDKDVMDFRGISIQETSGFDISLEAGQDILTVTNLAQHRRATFTLINDSTFFHVEPASECIQLNEQSSTIIVVRPRLEVLKKHMKTIRREKYICEVISLYNVDRPEERHWITLRITLDQSRYVQAIAVTHITLAYEVMEKRIAEFHSLLGKQLRRHVSSQRDVILDNTEQELSLSPPMERIPFAFRYIVDQLSYYCTIKTGGRFFQLACLFFSLLLHPLIQYPEYNEWTEHWQRGLSEFLSIFPETNEKLQDLRRLLDTTPTMTNSLQNTTSNSNTMSNYPITGGLTRAISYNTSRSEETM